MLHFVLYGARGSDSEDTYDACFAWNILTYVASGYACKCKG